MTTLERIRAAWCRAANFPADKENVYADHAAVQEFSLHAGKRVLEYGCGGGSDALSYLRRGCTVWYVDIVPSNVEATRRRIQEASVAPNGYIERAFAVTIQASDEIPVASEDFDIVNAHGVLHHIEDPRPVLETFHRILRPGGLLYVMLYTEHLWDYHYNDAMRLVEMEKCESIFEAFGWCTDDTGTPYAKPYTEATGRELIEGVGFRVLSAKTYNQDWFRTFKAVRVSE